jgi:hypothetical protein
MWPVQSVGMMRTPAASAMSATSTSRASTSWSTLSGEGWKASHNRKSRTESIPSAATLATSRCTSSRSKRDHQAMADEAGQ